MKPVTAAILLAMAAAYAPQTDFSVIITVYTGTRPLWTYRLSDASVSVTRHYTDGRPEATRHTRGLTADETRRLDRFFRGFPLESLEPRYTDERVDGDSCSRYLVTVNGKTAESYVCYARPARLAELNGVMNRLLPRQYRLWTAR